jgi:hypothetical protein
MMILTFQQMDSPTDIGEVIRPSFAGQIHREEKMLRAIISWWRGYSEADMESVKERLSYPNNSGTISIQVTNPERRALRDLRNLRKPSGGSLKPSSSLKPLANLPDTEGQEVTRP